MSFFHRPPPPEKKRTFHSLLTVNDIKIIFTLFCIKKQWAMKQCIYIQIVYVVVFLSITLIVSLPVIANASLAENGTPKNGAFSTEQCAGNGSC